MLWINLRQALRSLTANKLRSFLTMLGIIIGVGAVIALVSLGTGANVAIARQFESFGQNTITVNPSYGGPQSIGAISSAQSRAGQMGFSEKDCLALRELGTSLNAVAPIYETGDSIVSGRQSLGTSIRGVTPEYLEVQDLRLTSGRFITEEDIRENRRVAVLTPSLIQALASGESGGGIMRAIGGGGFVYQEAIIVDSMGQPAAQTPPRPQKPLEVGDTFRLRNQVYLVVGILEEESGSFFSGPYGGEQVVYLPMSTAQRVFQGAGESMASRIVLKVESSEMIEFAKAQARSILRASRGLAPDEQDNFSFFDQQQIQEAVQQSTMILTLLLSAIAAISLLVGGIGIMNIMLVSVTERTREIGLRKALGATRFSILGQFLTESIILTVLGGALGTALGYGGAVGISSITAFFQDYSGGAGLTAIITPQAVGMALGVSIGIGLFFGIWPANRAARMNPIDALRYE